MIVESPGRINLIGEHTDYNMGFAMPTAIDKKIVFSIRKNGSDRHCLVRSVGYDRDLQFDLGAVKKSGLAWENYILGVVNELLERTDHLKGFDCHIESHLPIGAGLSSSAALECGLAYGLNELFALGLDKMEIVSLSQKAEHSFVGTECGIMDQYASVMSKEGHVLLLDCASLESQYIPIDIEPYKLLLLNTNVSHNLATSQYNVRKAQCEEGVRVLRKSNGQVHTLRDVHPDLLEACKNNMDPVVYQRCKFVLEENERVLQAAAALKDRDLKAFGNILYQGHEGLSRLYEVSCPESDFLVEYTRELPFILGSRQMGGGFGGCTLNIIREQEIPSFVEAVSKDYHHKFNIQLSHFVASPAGGTSVKWIG